MFGHSESHFESFPKKTKEGSKDVSTLCRIELWEVIWQINPKNITQEIPALEFPL